MTQPQSQSQSQSQATFIADGIEWQSKLDQFAPDADDGPEGGENNE